MKTILKNLFTSIVLLSFGLPTAQAGIYIVKKHDTLSGILYAHDVKPIYGKKGALKKVVALNPHLEKQGHTIFPGEKINIPDDILTQFKQDKELESAIAKEKEILTKKTEVASEEKAINPQPEEGRSISTTVDQSFYTELSLILNWRSLSSSDSNQFRNSEIKALSNTGYGAGALYGMRFNETMNLYSAFALETVTFEADGGLSLEKDNFIATTFRFGLLYKERWSLEALMADNFYLTSPLANTVTVKKILLPELRGGFKDSFYQFREASLLYNVGAKIILPRSGDGVDPEMSFGGDATLEAKLRNKSFAIGYEYDSLKASSNTTKAQRIFWKFNYEL